MYKMVKGAYLLEPLALITVSVFGVFLQKISTCSSLGLYELFGHEGHFVSFGNDVIIDLSTVISPFDIMILIILQTIGVYCMT